VSTFALNRRQAAELPWYMTRRAFRGRDALRNAAKEIDQELAWRFNDLPSTGRAFKAHSFTRMDYGRVTWDMSWGRYKPLRWRLNSTEKQDDDGFVIPASSLALPADPFDAVPVHVAYMLDLPSIEDMDDGFQIFGGLEHETEIYFLEGAFSGLIKIGIASSLSSRVASIQSGSPEPLSLICHLPGSKQLERFLHGLFEPLRSHGEWFRPHWSLHAVIMGLEG
jgi:hypothetical protein